MRIWRSLRLYVVDAKILAKVGLLAVWFAKASVFLWRLTYAKAYLFLTRAQYYFVPIILNVKWICVSKNNHTFMHYIFMCLVLLSMYLCIHFHMCVSTWLLFVSISYICTCQRRQHAKPLLKNHLRLSTANIATL